MPSMSSTIIHLSSCLVSLILLLVSVPIAANQTTGTANQATSDPRSVYRQGAANWLSAIGQLRVPSSRLQQNGQRKHFYEDCSATLLAPGALAKTDYILTAWHCLEYYEDLSRSIVFTLPHQPGSEVTRNATVIAHGGSMAADWALLRLESSIDAEGAARLPLSTITAQADTSMAVTMAGFSRDEGLGQGGKMLTYDPRCSVLRFRSGIAETNCTAFKGSSGGPALQRNAEGSMVISGVISQGDGAGLSTYIPTGAFASKIIPLIAR